MGNRKKATIIIGTSIIFIYVIFAIIETINLGSKTVDEAFEKYMNSEFKTEVAQNAIGNKEFYRKGKPVFVPFEVNDNVSLVLFEKGVFGWKRTYYSNNSNEGYSYSTFVDELNGEILLHGVIPKDIVTEIKAINVNGNEADIVMLNDKTGIWLMMNDNKDNFNNIKIDFIDEVGNVVAEM
ncbi:hypothetical protein [Mesobacillus selenatarsenatis]|uniref:Uncharacterized protein n=1 Tax=Mesobacillus selenatarsenatis (strain DSM 18680 / JCM 14380 / FERM P-15431 / SF-1) TaxID=1321606 RepID=A0A0A8X0D5_MESS1|nr:hypothetical protein [Mesobacillus selenatarsenatis]GAM12472.1 hypothetical protein SAMD00020551_0607 [Mesobacillus selenatarsenatis SF-1]